MHSALLTFVLIVAAFAIGFSVGRSWGRHAEREIWRESVRDNLKRWRKEALMADFNPDSWLGGK